VAGNGFNGLFKTDKPIQKVAGDNSVNILFVAVELDTAEIIWFSCYITPR
jgi:hypothetical protein